MTASCQIYVYCRGAHHLGRDIILPGGRPPVNVMRKGGRSPFERTGLSSDHAACRNVRAQRMDDGLPVAPRLHGY
jgi:hypothetical protein